MVDLHSHILPGVDDGSRSLTESVEMARECVADGVAVIVATPHVRADYPTTADTITERIKELRAALRHQRISLQVLPGAEIALDQLERLPPGEIARLGLGGNPNCLLVETPYVGWPLDLGARLFALCSRGITPVLAHPERSPDVQQQPELLRPLLQMGVLVQLTAESLIGGLGRPARASAQALLAAGMAHVLASDSHAPARRRSGLSEAVRALGNPELGRWLTCDVPRAILTGGNLPPAPAARSGVRQLLRRRLRR